MLRLALLDLAVGMTTLQAEASLSLLDRRTCLGHQHIIEAAKYAVKVHDRPRILETCVLKSRRTPFTRDRSAIFSIVLWPVFITHSGRRLTLDQSFPCQVGKKRPLTLGRPVALAGKRLATRLSHDAGIG